MTLRGRIHQLGVKEVTSSTVKIEVRSDPQEATLSVGDERKFDVDGDGTYDLMVLLNSIIGGKADLSISSIEEDVTEGTVGEQEEAEEGAQEQSAEDQGLEPEGNNLWIWIVVVLVILAAVGFGASKLKK